MTVSCLDSTIKAARRSLVGGEHAMRVSPNPEVLTWAIRRCGEDAGSLVRAFPKLEDWISGESQPTLKQAESFARRTHVSLDLLFANSVPELGLQIADFRTLGGTRAEPSPELYDTVNQMMYRQDWMRSYFLEEGHDPVPIVGAFGDSHGGGSDAEVADAIKGWLSLEGDWAFSLPDSQAALRCLRDAAEAKRVSVVINGIVGDNTHRPLSVSEFRGFVLSDSAAPLIFINGRDAKAAQIFTLAHELAHLAFAKTGVVAPEAETADEGLALERRCDSIAAELLMPGELFADTWHGGDRNGGYARCLCAAKAFKTSVPACARRAVGLGLMGWPEYRSVIDQHLQRNGSSRTSGGGGNYYHTKGDRLGAVFSDAVLTALKSNAITYVEAFRLTGLGPKTFDAYFEGIV